MDAAFLYIVKFWISPQGAQLVLHWLDTKHIAEVVAQPGFHSVRRVKLEEKSADGWQAYMMIYGVDSRDALMRYFDSDAPRQFVEECKPFEVHLRTDRGWGAIDLKIG